MVVNRILTDPIDISRFPNAPRTDKGIVKRFDLEGLEVAFHKNAIPSGSESVVSIGYAMTVKDDGEYIYAISLEREDLRILASMLGISVKELQSDYGTKSFYGSYKIVMYGNDRKEDIGAYPGEMEESAILNYFLEAVYDSFDTVEDAEELV